MDGNSSDSLASCLHLGTDAQGSLVVEVVT